MVPGSLLSAKEHHGDRDNVNANLLTPHIANASRRHDTRAVASIRDVAPRAGRRTLARTEA
jgi:hypothetical protein